MVKAKYSGSGNGQVRAPSTHEGSKRRPVTAPVVGYCFVLARQVSQSPFHRLGDGEAGVVDDVTQVSLGQQVVPFVNFIDSKQHGLGPAESAEVESEGFRIKKIQEAVIISLFNAQ